MVLSLGANGQFSGWGFFLGGGVALSVTWWLESSEGSSGLDIQEGFFIHASGTSAGVTVTGTPAGLFPHVAALLASLGFRTA